MAGMLLASVAGSVLAFPSMGLAQAEASKAVHNFSIPAQPLDAALMDFGQQAGLQVSIDAAELAGRTSEGVSGRMASRDALTQLLADSGLAYRVEGNVVSLEPRARSSADGSVQLGLLRVEGQQSGSIAAAQETGAERDARKKDAVYDKDISSTYAAKEEIERYKGVNTADVLKGMVNVFSGDARNGGALDPSIRGIQGPGRVPVVIDGTEQALTVWRGYNGASNRSYVDPSLISGLQVLKGPVSARGVNGSTGGAIVINTLDASDILQPGKGISDYQGKGILNGTFNASFTGAGGTLTGSLANAGSTYGVNIGTATINPTGTFSGSGASATVSGSTVAAAGAVNGRFFGANVNALAGTVKFGTGATSVRQYDTAFGGTKN